MKKLLVSLLLVLLLVPMQSYSCLACTDFAVASKDGNVIVGRSMEWGEDLQSRICFHAKGEKRASTAPGGKPGTPKPGKQWTGKYNYFSLDAYQQDLSLDGLNDQGFAMEMLWYPPAVYQKIDAKDADKAVSIYDLGFYILGNYKSVEEFEHDLPNIQIWGEPSEKWPINPTVHLALHDATGKNLVVEFVDGQVISHDNPNTVLTNAPNFQWHITNLANYITLTPDTPTPLHVKGSVLSPHGQGGGFIGIPGDWTPPSRFVRTSCMLAYADPAQTTDEGLVLAQHVLNAVDIPKGDIRDQSTGYCDYSQWSVIKDLKNKKLYYRSYKNLNLRCLDLSKFSESEKHAPVAIN